MFSAVKLNSGTWQPTLNQPCNCYNTKNSAEKKIENTKTQRFCGQIISHRAKTYCSLSTETPNEKAVKNFKTVCVDVGSCMLWLMCCGQGITF